MIAIVLVGAAMIFTHPVAASSAPTLEEVSKALADKGPRETVHALSATGRFQYVLNRIGGGDSAWIRLAPRLAEGADGADAEGLGIALAEALPKIPRAVLASLDAKNGVVLGPSRVCSAPFIEPKPGVVERYKPRAIRAVMSVRTPALQPVAAACLAALRKP